MNKTFTLSVKDGEPVYIYESLTDHKGKRTTANKIVFQGDYFMDQEQNSHKHEFIYALQEREYFDKFVQLKTGQALVFKDERGSESSAIVTRLI